jgi:hypothetical protein
LSEFELIDYYLYFIITSLGHSKVEADNWCTISHIFHRYAHKQDYVISDKTIKFEYDFMGSINTIGLVFSTSAPDDILKLVFRFMWSLKEYHGMPVVCRYGMMDVWRTIAIRLNYDIFFNNGVVEFRG